MERATTLSELFNKLFDDDFKQDIEIGLDIAQIGAVIQQTADNSGLSLRQIARGMGMRSPSTVQRLLEKGTPHNATVETLVRFAHACGVRFVLRAEPLATKVFEHPTSREMTNVIVLDDYRPNHPGPFGWTPTRTTAMTSETAAAVPPVVCNMMMGS